MGSVSLEQASNPFTERIVLDKLLGHRSGRVRRAAKRNPHVNLETIRGFDLAELGQPLNPEWLEWMLTIPDSPFVQRLAALHPNTPAVTLDNLVTSGYGEFVAQNGRAPVALLMALWFDETMRIPLARNPHLPLGLQEKLSTDLDWEVREALAKNPHLHVETMARLLTDEDWDVQEALARNPSITPNWLASLAQSDWFATREAVADHPLTPPSALEQLVHDLDEEVRFTAALNANVPTNALLWCAEQPDWRLRAAASVHPNTPQDTLDILAKDSSPQVAKLAVARGVHAAEADLLHLTKQSSSFARVLVATHPNARADMLRHLTKRDERRVLAYVAIHPNTDEETRAVLKRRGEWDLRLLLEVIEQAKAPPPEHQGVVQPPSDARMRRALASRSDTHKKWLQVLASDADRGVQLALAANPITPLSVLANLSNDEIVRDLITRREDLPDALIETLGDVDQALAANTSLTVERYARLSKKQHLPVRTMLATNPTAIKTTFDTLLEDQTLAVPRALLNNQALTKPQIRNLALYRGTALRKPDERDSSYSIRREIALTTTEEDILLELTRDDDFRVLLAFVNRTDCSPTLLRALIGSQLERYQNIFRKDEVNQHNLLRVVARRADTPTDVLEQLVGFKDAMTHLLIAEHPNAPGNTLTRLYLMSDGIVQDAVLRHPNTTTSLLDILVFEKPQHRLIQFWLWWQRFARLTSTTQFFVERLSAPHLEQFKTIARHQNTSERSLNFLKRLTKHSRHSGFQALAAIIKQRPPGASSDPDELV